MHYLSLKNVRDLERAFELRQAPIDELVTTLTHWIQDEKNRALHCEDGAIDAAKALLSRLPI